jgi:Cys-tRNA(Pro)/Cys-tRNA(Cys) deacylase
MVPAVSTPALALLQARGVAHAVHRYEINELSGQETHRGERLGYGVAAAAALGVAPAQLFKTLVVTLVGSGTPGELVLAVLPSDSTLSERAVATVFSAKRAILSSHSDVMRATGSVPGGVSPISTRQTMRTVIDVSALSFPNILISAGRRSLAVALAPEDLGAICSAAYAEICTR